MTVTEKEYKKLERRLNTARDVISSLKEEAANTEFYRKKYKAAVNASGGVLDAEGNAVSQDTYTQLVTNLTVAVQKLNDWPTVNGTELNQTVVDNFVNDMRSNAQSAPAVPSGLAAIKLSIFDFINTKEGSKYPGAGVEDLTQEVCSGKEVKDSVDSSIHTQPFNLEKFCENAVVGEDYDPLANI